MSGVSEEVAHRLRKVPKINNDSYLLISCSQKQVSNVAPQLHMQGAFIADNPFRNCLFCGVSLVWVHEQATVSCNCINVVRAFAQLSLPALRTYVQC